MPTYEYKCLECGHKFDALQSMSAKPLSICPKCKGKLKRLIGMGSGIIFKGAGFYATDYKKNKSGPPSCPSPKGSGCENCPKAKE